MDHRLEYKTIKLLEKKKEREREARENLQNVEPDKEFLIKLNMQLLYDSALILLGICLFQRNECLHVFTKTHTPMFTEA